MGLTILPHSCADFLEILAASNSRSPQGLSRDCSNFHLHSSMPMHLSLIVLMRATYPAHLIALYLTTLQYFVKIKNYSRILLVH